MTSRILNPPIGKSRKWGCFGMCRLALREWFLVCVQVVSHFLFKKQMSTSNSATFDQFARRAIIWL
jgi:hypothetical protein